MSLPSMGLVFQLYKMVFIRACHAQWRKPVIYSTLSIAHLPITLAFMIPIFCAFVV